MLRNPNPWAFVTDPEVTRISFNQVALKAEQDGANRRFEKPRGASRQDPSLK